MWSVGLGDRPAVPKVAANAFTTNFHRIIHREAPVRVSPFLRISQTATAANPLPRIHQLARWLLGMARLTTDPRGDAKGGGAVAAPG
jgi:hypothetical protein